MESLIPLHILAISTIAIHDSNKVSWKSESLDKQWKYLNMWELFLQSPVLFFKLYLENNFLFICIFSLSTNFEILHCLSKVWV